MSCTCQTALSLRKELEIKEKLIEVLKDALNDPRYCEDHIVFRNCKKKDLQCGDCLIEEFYSDLEKESSSQSNGDLDTSSISDEFFIEIR